AERVAVDVALDRVRIADGGSAGERGVAGALLRWKIDGVGEGTVGNREPVLPGGSWAKDGGYGNASFHATVEECLLDLAGLRFQHLPVFVTSVGIDAQPPGGPACKRTRG